MESAGPAGACHWAGPPGPALGRPVGKLPPDPVGLPDGKLRVIRDCRRHLRKPFPHSEGAGAPCGLQVSWSATDLAKEDRPMKRFLGIARNGVAIVALAAALPAA